MSAEIIGVTADTANEEAGKEARRIAEKSRITASAFDFAALMLDGSRCPEVRIQLEQMAKSLREAEAVWLRYADRMMR